MKIFNMCIRASFLAGVVCASCSSNSAHTIVFANYQSYMSPWLTNNLTNRYDVNFQYFNIAETVPSQYKIDNYDASIVSSSVMENLISERLVQKINWSWFHLKDPQTKKSIESANDALKLFTEPVQTILSQTYKDSSGKFINLLDYAIPYYLQTFNFAYRGEKIAALEQPNLSWSQMLETISQQPRFHATNQPKIAMVSDPRTLLSTANIMAQNGHVDPVQYASVSQLSKSYQQYINHGLNTKSLGARPILLNSDSNVIINTLADNDGGVNGAFLYNGDALYAANGGDLGTDIPASDFHFVTNNQNLYALDLINFSNKVPQILDPQTHQPAHNTKLERLYKMAKAVSFEGLDQDSMLAESDTPEKLNTSNLAKVQAQVSGNCQLSESCFSYDYDVYHGVSIDDSNHYKYGPAINFDNVNYTPPLKKLYNELLGLDDSHEDDNITSTEINSKITDSYFYDAPEGLFFGKKDSDSFSDWDSLTPTNWSHHLEAINPDNLPEDEQSVETTKKSSDLNGAMVKPNEVTIDKLNYDQSAQSLDITYHLNSTPDELKDVTVDLTKSAIDNYHAAVHDNKAKAELLAHIMVINSTPNLEQLVEHKIDGLVKSNMYLAFNNLKSNW